jgi:hypothetical protein
MALAEGLAAFLARAASASRTLLDQIDDPRPGA